MLTLREKESVKLILTDTNFIDNKDSIRNYLNRIDEARKERILSNKLIEDKKRLTAAGLLLDYMCKEEAVSQPVFSKEKHGKLFLTNREDIKFNLSHSGKYAVCAYGRYEVGVDIQEKRVTNESMVARFLNQIEMEELPDDLTQRISKVNRLWCIKESFIKLIGLGLLYNMRDCIVELEKGHIIDITGHYDIAYFKDFVIEPDYHLSICSMHADLPENYNIIDFTK